MATPKIKKKVAEVNLLIDKLIETEYEFNLANEDFWTISYNFIDAAYAWAKKEPMTKVFSYIPDVYLGNFIKDMLKIYNISHNMINLCEINGNLDILPELHKIESLIVREFVVVNSLYL